MVKSDDNQLLTGILIAGFVFIVLWEAFAAGIILVGWAAGVNFFSTRLDVPAALGGAMLAFFSVRKIGQWILRRGSRPVNL